MAKNKGFDINNIRGEIYISPDERAQREYIKKEEYRLGMHIGYDNCKSEKSVSYSSVHKNKKDWQKDCAIAHECIYNGQPIPKDVEERLLITRKEHYGEASI